MNDYVQPATGDHPLGGAATAPSLAPAPIVIDQPRRRSGLPIRMILGGVAAVVALLIVGGGVLGSQGTGGTSSASGGLGSIAGGGNSTSDQGYSWYHDAYYDAGSYSPQWHRDGTFRDQEEWTYDGAYDYSGYGRAGLKDRARGRAKGRQPADPLYGTGAADDLPDVFDTLSSDQLDPAGGRPVGAASGGSLNPWYDPYGGASNPYENRLRLAYGDQAARDYWMR